MNDAYEKLATEKAFLFTINYMYHKFSEVRGLDENLSGLVDIIMDLIGGADIYLVYRYRRTWKLFKNRRINDYSLESPPEKEALREGRVIELGEASHRVAFFMDETEVQDMVVKDVIFPLKNRTDCFGFLRINGMIISDDRINREIEIFLQYAAVLLYDEIKKTEEEHEIKAMLNQIFEANPEGMFVIDNEFRILRINQAMSDLLGMDSGVNIKNLRCRDIIKCSHCMKTEECIMKKSLLSRDIVEFDSDVVDSNGVVHYCIFSARTLTVDNTDIGVIVTVRDNTEREQIKRALSESLREKEVLLREIHHRVKNNLQIMSSLLSLQAGELVDDTAAALFLQNQSRIIAMAAVHENLYRAGDLSHINLHDYIHRLTDNLDEAYDLSAQGIVFHISREECFLNIDTAIPVGLIINELINNSLKHGNDSGKMDIYIEYVLGEGSLALHLSDTGPGFPEGFDPHSSGGLGMKLIIALTDQLDGSFTLGKRSPSSVEIKFAV